MQMLNRAIEDAADFKAFQEALTKRPADREAEARIGTDNRAQRRARERAARKTSKKVPKVSV